MNFPSESSEAETSCRWVSVSWRKLVKLFNLWQTILWATSRICQELLKEYLLPIVAWNQVQSLTMYSPYKLFLRLFFTQQTAGTHSGFPLIFYFIYLFFSVSNELCLSLLEQINFRSRQYQICFRSSSHYFYSRVDEMNWMERANEKLIFFCSLAAFIHITDVRGWKVESIPDFSLCIRILWQNTQFVILNKCYSRNLTGSSEWKSGDIFFQSMPNLWSHYKCFHILPFRTTQFQFHENYFPLKFAFFTCLLSSNNTNKHK